MKRIRGGGVAVFTPVGKQIVCPSGRSFLALGDIERDSIVRECSKVVVLNRPEVGTLHTGGRPTTISLPREVRPLTETLVRRLGVERAREVYQELGEALREQEQVGRS